jgi:hypothetical protein
MRGGGRGSGRWRRGRRLRGGREWNRGVRVQDLLYEEKTISAIRLMIDGKKITGSLG